MKKVVHIMSKALQTCHPKSSLIVPPELSLPLQSEVVAFQKRQSQSLNSRDIPSKYGVLYRAILYKQSTKAKTRKKTYLLLPPIQ